MSRFAGERDDGFIELDVYDAHLRFQAGLSFESETVIFDRLDAWSGTTTVVDLGCGTGAHLHLLAQRHPEKRFIGVDIREDAISVARRDHPAPNIEYRAGRITTLDDDADILMARFCLLYVDDLHDIVDWARRHIALGVLQIDNEDARLHFPPELTEFAAGLHVTRAREAEGRSRTAAIVTAPLWEQSGFHSAASEVVELGTEQGIDRTDLHRLLRLMGQAAYGSPLPPGHAAALDAWLLTTAPFRYAVRSSWFERRG